MGSPAVSGIFPRFVGGLKQDPRPRRGLRTRHPPARDVEKAPSRGRVPTLPCARSDLRLESSDLWLDPGMAAAVPNPRWGPSPFLETRATKLPVWKFAGHGNDRPQHHLAADRPGQRAGHMASLFSTVA